MKMVVPRRFEKLQGAIGVVAWLCGNCRLLQPCANAMRPVLADGRWLLVESLVRMVISANRFLRPWLVPFNRQFERPAASALDVPRAGPRNLDAGLGWEAQRVVQADWTAACGGKGY